MLAERPAVIAKEDHDGIVREFQSVQSLQDFADLRVDETDAGKIGALKNAKLFGIKTVIERLGGERNGRNVGDVVWRFLRQKNLFERIKVEIFFRRDIRNVRTIKAGGDEEWPIFMLLEQPYCFGSDFSVSLFFVRAFGFHPAKSSAQLTLPSEIDNVRLVVAVASARIDELVPRGRVVQPAGPDLAGDAVVIDFADAG